ncbi:MAG: N-6 DNA methylase [Bacteroidota bacterium]|nr:N-6 DNA methylase [Bacteroidota bacterium]
MSSEFAAIRIVGELMPTEYLTTITRGNAPQQKAINYGLSTPRSLSEEQLRFWQTALTVYQPGESRRTRRRGKESGIEDFLDYVLGYDDIEPVSGKELDGRSFALSHTACGGAFPILLVSRAVDLDRPEARFSSNGSQMTPHRVVQEYLNADPAALWGMVSNGSRLRILRDNPSLSRPVYLEADVERIISEDLYSEFQTLWLVTHATRFRPANRAPSSCIFEDWRKLAQETGERARNQLRVGVAKALVHLGTGFVSHPANEALRDTCLQKGASAAGFLFGELLHLMYRLLFLFTVEERNLLHGPDAADEARDIYSEGYSLNRLRERARYRRHYDQYSDLWKSLQIVFRSLSTGAPELGLPALGGMFGPEYCPILDNAAISNRYLLQAVSDLGFLRTGQSLTRVNYADMGAEELGSMYESLLELHPSIDFGSGKPKFNLAGIESGSNSGGSTRRLTGSYYTPPALVHQLVSTALDPVIKDATASRPDDPRTAILDLRVIDPACGSGNFLKAAAHRLATELVRLDSNIDEPGTQHYQRAMRDVLQHCIFGVDKNPLAVELCRATLWMAAVDPGKPLTFLDNHVRTGDSLVGVFSENDMTNGIPNEAYTALPGDSKSLCKDLKRANKHSGRASGSLFDQQDVESVADTQLELHFMPENSLADIDRKRSAWETQKSVVAEHASRLRADLFVSAFVTAKVLGARNSVPVSGDLSKPCWSNVDREMRIAVRELRDEFQYFHWHLQFAEIVEMGGFDVVFANPPWERFKIQEKEFFSAPHPAIAAAPNKAARNKLIQALNSQDSSAAEKALYDKFQKTQRKAKAIPHFARNSGRFPLTAKGDLNNYPLFAELCLNILKPTGRAGLVVPTGIATDKSTANFFASIVDDGRVASLFDFENREKVFQGIDSRLKFCLLTLRGKGMANRAGEYVFYLRQPHQLKETERRVTMTREDFALFNPNTRTCPTFRTGRDVEVARKIYQRAGVLWRDKRGFMPEENPWGIKFSRMFDMSNDSGLFRTREELEDDGWVLEGNIFTRADEKYLPLYEAKLFHQYDHRFATFGTDTPPKTREVTSEEKSVPSYVILPRYWVSEGEVLHKMPPPRKNHAKRRPVGGAGWIMVLRRFARSTDQRTTFMSLMMRTAIGDSGVIVEFGS